MDRNRMKERLTGGFERFFSDGMTVWTKKNVHGAINPLGERHELDEPEIQEILKELEQEGLIKLKYEDEFYLEVLKG
jgi:hypothetical protein